MSNYLDTLDKSILDYFKILSKDFPDFLIPYIEVPQMQKQAKICVSCGTYYSKMYNGRWFSSLDHSIGVALIIWNFTKDKRQTLAGLFHDIATPAFKHCIDFMNGDYEKQESTEELTKKFIIESEEIMKLLKRDNIDVNEVSDYHIYPIADNDTPRLSSDRLEYTLSNSLGTVRNLCTLDEVKEIYNDIEIQKNEDGIDELGFKSFKVAEKFEHIMSTLSTDYLKLETKFSMQFLADIMKKMSNIGLITKDDLYLLSEAEIIEKIENCNYDNISNCFKSWKNATKINESDKPIDGLYCVGIDNVKVRYINPLVQTENGYNRIFNVSYLAQNDIEKVLSNKTKKFGYLDFNF